MSFLRVSQVYIEGATLYGWSLDSLHSEKPDVEELREWLCRFADLDPAELEDPNTGEKRSFYDIFLHDVLDFCVYIAESDGVFTAGEAEAIKKLFGKRVALSDSNIERARSRIRNGLFSRYYPVSFTMLVFDLGNGSDDVQTAAQIAFFFRQVARYVYSVNNPSFEFDRDCPVREYVDALFKYVERVSATDFVMPEDEFKIDEIRSSWNRLNELAGDNMRKIACGKWKAVTGGAMGKGGLSDLVLESDGKGHMLKQKLLGSKKIDLSWRVMETDAGYLPVVKIPSMQALLIMTILDSNRMIASVFAPNRIIDKRTAMYERA